MTKKEGTIFAVINAISVKDSLNKSYIFLGVHAECDGMNEKQFKATNKENYTCPICRSKSQ